MFNWKKKKIHVHMGTKSNTLRYKQHSSSDEKDERAHSRETKINIAVHMKRMRKGKQKST